MQTTSIAGDSARDIFARFLRELSQLTAATARELELGERPAPKYTSLDQLDLGTLQAAIVRVPGLNSEEGLKPRLIAERLGRADEPNIRMTLQALARRGVVEMVPGVSPQHWRLVAIYRTGSST